MTLRKAEQKTVISSNDYLDDRMLTLMPLQLTFHNAKANTLGDEYHTTFTYLHTAKEAFDE